MQIEVTGCHNCPFRDDDFGFCNRLDILVGRFIAEETCPSSCPLKQETITIKLKENDTTRN